MLNHHPWRVVANFHRNLLSLVLNQHSRNEIHPELDRPAFDFLPAVDFGLALANARKWCTTVNPQVSILVINWNATQLTLECVRQIWANTEDVTYEIVIADNGSNRSSIAPLRNFGVGVRLIELGINRFFGEANNIAAEAAAGKYICFLNNDAFVRKGWLRALVTELETDQEIGAVGPKFLFPDGSIQEAGCIMNEEGIPIRIGRHLDPRASQFNVPKFVDYVSGATLLMEKRLFLDTGGFDLAYEPAYYEDADLCFKLRIQGRKSRYCPAAEVVHVENASSGRMITPLERNAIGDLNRKKFLARWGPILTKRPEAESQEVRSPIRSLTGRRQEQARVSVGRGSAAIFTPFALTPGGGERVILTLAATLGRSHRVTFVTRHPYSKLRVQGLAREFNVDLPEYEVSTYDDFKGNPEPDLLFVLGNHVVPPIPAKGKRNFYICQFPFPMDPQELQEKRSNLENYREILTYSHYVREHVLRSLAENGLSSVPVTVLNPPVPMIGGDAANKKNAILQVGRFFLGGHNKRADLMIEAFRKLRKGLGEKLKLDLAGSAFPEKATMDYLGELTMQGKGLPVRFHVNVPAHALETLYRDAAVYWHGTGLGSDLERAPGNAEHFGISIVEAMSAQCVPIAYDAGGPREIITHGTNGFLYRTQEELVELTKELFESDPARRIAIGRAAAQTALLYSVDRFSSSVSKYLEMQE